MRCTNPILLKDYNITVPCRKCFNCRIERTTEWSIRIIHESTYHEESVFVTLTYNDEKVKNGIVLSLCKDHLLDFVKKLRKLVYPRLIKYFGCGEYGPTTYRPHYHIILFGINYNTEDKNLIDKAWNKGFTTISYLTLRRAKYTAKYIQKKYDGILARKIYSLHGLAEPFQIQSSGIGLRWALDNEKTLRNQLHIRLDGKKVGIPRYYRRKLNFNDVMYYKVINEMQDGIMSRYKRYSDDEILPKIIESRYQQEHNTKAKLKLYKKKGREI